eukprot:1788396-Prorocentrum_lima.AAC.1
MVGLSFDDVENGIVEKGLMRCLLAVPRRPGSTCSSWAQWLARTPTGGNAWRCNPRAEGLGAGVLLPRLRQALAGTAGATPIRIARWLG